MDKSSTNFPSLIRKKLLRWQWPPNVSSMLIFLQNDNFHCLKIKFPDFSLILKSNVSFLSLIISWPMAMLINENVSRQAKRISFLSVTVWFLGSLDPKSGYSTKRQCRSFSKAIPLMPVPARSPLPKRFMRLLFCRQKRTVLNANQARKTRNITPYMYIYCAMSIQLACKHRRTSDSRKDVCVRKLLKRWDDINPFLRHTFGWAAVKWA